MKTGTKIWLGVGSFSLMAAIGTPGHLLDQGVSMSPFATALAADEEGGEGGEAGEASPAESGDAGKTGDEASPKSDDGGEGGEGG